MGEKTDISSAATDCASKETVAFKNSFCNIASRLIDTQIIQTANGTKCGEGCGCEEFVACPPQAGVVEMMNLFFMDECIRKSGMGKCS
ncbi:MAG TPA: hypothetical protein VMU30_12890 [Bacteroidota bacterium]|nr:hypothetical protein [Bacteroidota bacterium]